MEVEKFPRYRGLLLPLLVALLAVPTSASVLVGAAAGVRRWYDDSDMMIPIIRSKNEARSSDRRVIAPPFAFFFLLFLPSIPSIPSFLFAETDARKTFFSGKIPKGPKKKNRTTQRAQTLVGWAQLSDTISACIEMQDRPLKFF